MENDSTKKLYEVGYLLVPLIAEDKVADEVNILRSSIENAGGFIALEEQPKMRKLAYEVKQRGIASKKLNFGDAYFGWIRFQLAADRLAAVNESFDKNDKILRFLIVKPVKDSPRVIRSTGAAKPNTESARKEKKETMSDQELDKEIDQLLDAGKAAA